MTTYSRNDRYSWRRYARRLMWRINYLLAAMAVAVLLLATAGPATAAPRCPGGTATPRGCVYQPDPATVCAWPARIVRIGQVVLCVRTAPEVQP